MLNCLNDDPIEQVGSNLGRDHVIDPHVTSSLYVICLDLFASMTDVTLPRAQSLAWSVLTPKDQNKS
jgi:hypothetical protein